MVHDLPVSTTVSRVSRTCPSPEGWRREDSWGVTFRFEDFWRDGARRPSRHAHVYGGYESAAQARQASAARAPSPPGALWHEHYPLQVG